MARDFIRDFMQETQNLQTPDIFRLWGGIATVSAALQRNAWITTDSGPIFPNTYIFLVAPPGVGKGVMIDKLGSYLHLIETLRFGRSDMSKASFIDELVLGEVPGDPMKGIKPYNSLTVFTEELGTLVGEYDLQFMSVLTRLWNCKDYSEKKRHNKMADIEMERVHVTMLMGTQPGFLQNLIPDIAWEQGFLSRVHLVYANSAPPVPLWSGTQRKSNEEELQKMLLEISRFRGEFDVTPQAKRYLEDWHAGDRKATDPTHPKLQNYNSRRTEHYIKLCMIAAAARGEHNITVDVCHRALGWLTNVEENTVEGLRDITNTAISKDDVPQMIYDFMLQEYGNSGGQVVPGQKLTAFVAKLVRPHEVSKLIEVMVKAGYLRDVGGDYRPGTPE